MKVPKVLTFAATVGAPSAQTQETFQPRLSPVSIDAQSAAVVTGHGTVSRTVAGTALTMSGTLEGLRSAATTADLYQSKINGVPGALIHKLTVSKALEGNITGSVTLTSPEVDALHKGLLYVVVHSVDAPIGNFRGWLVK
jgi:hypothetical protein